MNSDTTLPQPKSPQSSGTEHSKCGPNQMGNSSSSAMAKNGTSAPSTILALPTELLQLIATNFLDPLDALHFAAANHATRVVILPAVYARVVITSRRALVALARAVECGHGSGNIDDDHDVGTAKDREDEDNHEALEHGADVSIDLKGTHCPRAQLKAIVISERALCAKLTTDMLDTLFYIVRTCPHLATVDCSAGRDLWGDDEELTNHVRIVFSNIVSLLVPRRGQFSAPTVDLLPWTSVALCDGPGAGTTAAFALNSIDFASGRIGGILRHARHSVLRLPDAWRAACAHWTVGKTEIVARGDTLTNGNDARATTLEDAAAVTVLFSWPTVDLGVITFDLPPVPAPAWAAWVRRFMIASTAGMTEAWVHTYIPTISVWRNLRLLSLGACMGVSDTTVVPLMEALGNHLPNLRTLALTQVEASYAALLPALGKLVDRGTVRDVMVLGFSARAATAAAADADAAPLPDAVADPIVFAPAITRIKLDQRYRSMQSSLLRPVFSIDPTAAARLTVLSLSGITLASSPFTTSSPSTSFRVVPFGLPRPADPASPAQLSTPVLPSLLALRTDGPLRLPACPRLQCLVIENAAHYHRATAVADLLSTQFPTVRAAVVMNTFLTIAQTDRLAGTLSGMAGAPRSGPRAKSGEVRTSPVDVLLARNVAPGLDGWLMSGASGLVADGHGEVDLNALGVEGGGALRLVANEVGQRMVDRVLRAWQL
ncbi:hypothetical protein AMAG_16102 [Allomyces macrogynus ATCC 38327]|uniref:Uncharacterized protein n=1 Tax=Allomyces macrogynus (strain ATCC 38327) TaxID=578462 RepID=A0A0L0TAP8_ALLM3|nr:hypothetical protein AMAG_16102 [Allomyces macrogynus ATCC 38327]|eukprot:KNE71796.1 hypothetical protein AMAG_16102 [Allomyces macrogynus ATCC 38327]